VLLDANSIENLQLKMHKAEVRVVTSTGKTDYMKEFPELLLKAGNFSMPITGSIAGYFGI